MSVHSCTVPSGTDISFPFPLVNELNGSLYAISGQVIDDDAPPGVELEARQALVDISWSCPTEEYVLPLEFSLISGGADIALEDNGYVPIWEPITVGDISATLHVLEFNDDIGSSNSAILAEFGFAEPNDVLECIVKVEERKPILVESMLRHGYRLGGSRAIYRRR